MENPSLDKLIIFDDWIMCEPLKEERDFGQGLVSPTTHDEKTYKAIGKNYFCTSADTVPQLCGGLQQTAGYCDGDQVCCHE